ncbi:hypothetical protein PTKIN_Ptkin16aG0089800 [Pterospermum kingtungense]
MSVQEDSHKLVVNLKALKVVLIRAWQVATNLEVIEIGHRIFLFKFSTARDRAKVHGIPLNFMNEKTGILIGDKIGQVEEVDIGHDRKAWGKFLRIRKFGLALRAGGLSFANSSDMVSLDGGSVSRSASTGVGNGVRKMNSGLSQKGRDQKNVENVERVAETFAATVSDKLRVLQKKGLQNGVLGRRLELFKNKSVVVNDSRSAFESISADSEDVGSKKRGKSNGVVSGDELENSVFSGLCSTEHVPFSESDKQNKASPFHEVMNLDDIPIVFKTRQGSASGATKWKRRVVSGKENSGSDVGSKIKLEKKSVARAGGLSLLWVDDVDLSIVSFSHHHIDAHVHNFEDHFNCRRTGFYGDFNEITMGAKKFGGGLRPKWQIVNFKEVTEGCGLVELPVEGLEFTWSRVSNEDIVFEWLDRAWITKHWLVHFPTSIEIYLAHEYLDHCPLLFRVKTKKIQRLKGVRPWRFEDCWVQLP